MATFARLDAFARGEVWGLHRAGTSVTDICRTVQKKALMFADAFVFRLFLENGRFVECGVRMF